MKFIYIIIVLLFISCRSNNNPVLTETQDWYLEELNAKKENLILTLKDRYNDGELSLDSIAVLTKSVVIFDSTFRDPKKNHIKIYQEAKSHLLNNAIRNINKRNYIPNPLTIIDLENALKISDAHFKITILRDFTKTLEYLINSISSISCCFCSNYRVKFNIYDITNKKEFLKNGVLYIDSRKSNFNQFDRVYFGKLNSTEYLFEYATEDSTEIAMTINEKFSIDYLYDNGTFPLSKLKSKNVKNTLEGMVRLKTNRNHYTFVPFQYTFND